MDALLEILDVDDLDSVQEYSQRPRSAVLSFLRLLVIYGAVIGAVALGWRLFKQGGPVTTAQRFAELLNSTNDYPVCNTGGCIESITYKGNTVIAVYVLPLREENFEAGALQNRAATAKKLKAEALGDFCGSLQDDFPDHAMRWAGHYLTADRKPIASILMSVSECPKFQ